MSSLVEVLSVTGQEDFFVCIVFSHVVPLQSKQESVDTSPRATFFFFDDFHNHGHRESFSALFNAPFCRTHPGVLVILESSRTEHYSTPHLLGTIM